MSDKEIEFMNYGENILVICCFYNAAFLEKVLKAKVDNRKKKGLKCFCFLCIQETCLKNILRVKNM